MNTWSSATRSHQSRSKKSSRPSTTSVAPETAAHDGVVVAHPAERPHRVRERDTGSDERRARGRASTRPAARRRGGSSRSTTRARGSRRARCRCTAPRTRRTRRRAARATRCPARAGAAPARPRARATAGRRRNARPSTTRTKPAISSCVRLSTVLPTAAAAAPSSTKTAVNPTMNGRLASSDAPRDAALAEPVDLDRRDRRQVAGDERQDARRHDRDEAGEERDRKLLKHRTARAPRRSARSISGSSAGRLRWRGAGRRPRASTARRRPSTTAPAIDAADRQHPGEQVEAVRRGRREDARPEVRDHLVEDLLLAPALRDPPADLGLHLLRDCGAVDWSSVSWQTGQTSFVSIASRSGAPPASAGAASTSASEQRARASLMSSARDGRARRAPRRVTGPSTCVDDPAAAVDEERRAACSRRRSRSSMSPTPSKTDRIGDAVLADERLRAGACGSRATSIPTTSRPCRPSARDARLQPRHLLLARPAVGRPEVDDDRLAAERRERDAAGPPPSRASVNAGAGTILLCATALARPSCSGA